MCILYYKRWLYNGRIGDEKMDKQLMIKIEEFLNNLPRSCEVKKVDSDLQTALEEALKHRKASVSDDSLYRFLCKQLEKRHFVKKSKLLDEAGFYTYAQISSNTWSNIRWGNGIPSKETLLKLIIALKMDEDDANELMRLGHNALKLSDPRDRVILALIDIRCYDIYTVYEVLEEYGQNRTNGFSNIYHFEP